MVGPLFLIAVVEEDGVVHGHTQLEHGGDGLCDVGNLPQKNIGAEVVENGQANAHKEGQREEPGVHGKGHGDEGEHHGQQDVDGQLLIHQVLGVLDEDREPGQEAALVAETAYLGDGRMVCSEAPGMSYWTIIMVELPEKKVSADPRGSSPGGSGCPPGRIPTRHC